MLKKFHNILGKLFLSGASFFWTSCDSGTSAEKPSAFIDIDKELAKLTTTDTTGLRGTCIPEYQYCEMTKGWSNHYNAQAHAASIAFEKLDERHKDDLDYYGNNSCYRDLLGHLGNAPVYGVPECPTGLTPCEMDSTSIYSIYKGVRIDDAYIAALQRKEKDYYETVKSTLEEINEGIEKCEVQ